MNCPVGTKVDGRRRKATAGFTLIEVLTALFVIGVATTVFIQLYNSSLSVARSNTHYAVAAQIAEEYMAELQVNPKQFIWPNFDDDEIATFTAIKLTEGSSLLVVDPPTAMPTTPKADSRETALYRDYSWHASARIHDAKSNFVEVLVTVLWEHKGKQQSFYLTSTVPRSVGEGIGL